MTHSLVLISRMNLIHANKTEKKKGNGWKPSHTPPSRCGCTCMSSKKEKKYLIKIKTAAREVNVSLHKNKYGVVHCLLELEQQRSRARR